jgi:hypothetical protein
MVLARLMSMVSRAGALAQAANDVVQTGVLAGEKLAKAVALVRITIALLEQLEASASELRQLGL